MLNFSFTQLLEEIILVGSFRAARRNRYHCIIGLIKSIDGFKADIDKAILESLTNQLYRASFQESIQKVITEYQDHLNKIEEINEFPEISSDYIKNIINDLNNIIYTTVRDSLSNRTIGNIRIQCRAGALGGFELIEQNPIGENSQVENHEETAGNQPKNIAAELTENETATVKLEEKIRKLEKHFYESVRNWALKNNDGVNCVITGGRLPFPKWENPDLVQVDAIVGQFTKKIEFEITAFEVKLRVEPYAVWQAANYKRFSSYVYVAFAKNEEDVRGQDGGRVFDIAVDLGVGVLVLENASDTLPVFKEIHAPRRNTPLDADINSVLAGYRSIDQIQNVIRVSESELENFLMPETAIISFRQETKTPPPRKL